MVPTISPVLVCPLADKPDDTVGDRVSSVVSAGMIVYDGMWIDIKVTTAYYIVYAVFASLIYGGVSCVVVCACLC